MENAPRENVDVNRSGPAEAIVPALKVVKSFGRLRPFRRCTILCPTWVGFWCITAVLFTLVAGWFTYGESFLVETHRSQADILVVEGWIGRKAICAAVDEFKRGGYRYVVAVGGMRSDRWEDKPANYAEMAADELIRLGVPKEEILVVTSKNTEVRRTFESAVAIWQTLRDAGIKPKALNVFTLGPHARRSALVFAKVNSSDCEVGVIGWQPPEYETEAWWQSSERSKELLWETVGYIYEVLLNSGRRSSSPAENLSSIWTTQTIQKIAWSPSDR